jgi:hypothetical protein
MADMFSILQSSYKAAGLVVPSKTPYVAVDKSLYEGSWTGKYPDSKTFTIKVSQVDGFRAQVAYSSGGTNKFQQVLIKDNAFRIGDTKFQLQAKNRALVKNVVNDPATGSTYLDQAIATRNK